MSATRPWMKFYPRDWRADEKLRLCSLAARGLWMEMLAIMHASEKYGRLLIAGKPPTDAQLAVQVGATADEIAALKSELSDAGVYSVDAAGIIYSRRMKSDEKTAETARKNGKLGGNPKLSKQTGKSSWDKGQDKKAVKGGDKLRGQKAEKKDNIEKSPHSIPADWKPLPFGEGTEAAEIVAVWSAKDLRHHAEQFVSHHRARGNKFKDWQDAWGTWVRNTRKFDRDRPAARGGSDPPRFLDHYREEQRRSAGAVQ